MDIRSLLQEVAVLIVVYKIIAVKGDIFDTFQPKEDNPPELNEFLNNVLEHKSAFNFVKQTARMYKKMKKDIANLDLDDALTSAIDYYSNDSPYKYRLEDKRNIHHHSEHNSNRKFRNPAFILPSMQHNKKQKITRRIKKDTDELGGDDREKRVPIILLRSPEDLVQKRMPAPMVMQPAKEKRPEKHIPSQIFIQDQGQKLDKRTPEEIEIESEGEKGTRNIENDMKTLKKQKKQIDLRNEIHKTFKPNPKHRMTHLEGGRQGDFYYVDLQEAAEKDKEKHDDRRRYWNPRNNVYYRRPNGRPSNRPMVKNRPDAAVDYYEPKLHHSLNDEVAFEKALSYEIEPRHQDQYTSYNNPSGNSLYSVDAGRPDVFEPINPQGPYQDNVQSMGRNDYPPQEPEAVTNERFFVNDNENSMKKAETSTTEEGTTNTITNITELSGERKMLKHVGDGFIDITKPRHNNEETFENPKLSPILHKKSLYPSNNERIYHEDIEFSPELPDKNKEESSMFSKHSLHPLRVKDTSLDKLEESFVEYEGDPDPDDESESAEKRSIETSEDSEEAFKNRKLLFNDDYMTNFYDQNEKYDEIPNRPRRDFLDALGMKNEEDYSEDNPYQEELKMNNTDIQNDTHIHTSTAPPETKKNISIAHQKEDVNHIKKILEDPKETTTVTRICNYKSKIEKASEKTRIKKNPEDDDFDILEPNELRMIRNANKDLEAKILKNKNKIFNSHEVSQSHNFNNNQVQARPERQERVMAALSKITAENQKVDNPQKKLIQLDHRINKKEDLDSLEPTTIDTSTEENFSETTSPEPINANYEQIANQMDIENEKLAQVVDGHLASKIVSTVFDELKKKSSLKAKFYSGLSRKHVNFAGTIDFDIFKTNETEDADEARLLLDQITKVLNRLVLNQVRRKLCQRLPDELKDYLDILLNVKNVIETTNFEPNTKQGDFLFTYQEKSEQPPFDVAKVQDTLVQLEGLLLSYHNMNEDCQTRAIPIKDYIEKHIEMLKKITNCPTNCENKLSESKRDTFKNAMGDPPALHNFLVRKQLESVGLGRNSEFVPNFDINQIVRNKMRAMSWKLNKKRDIQKNANYKSQKYKKLQAAVEKIREKRENEKKIAQLFGSKKKRSSGNLEFEYEEPVVYSLG